jgi:thioesterase domain-containing protein
MRKVLFAHGLESSPKGTKATYLAERFGAVSPALFEFGLEKQVQTIVDALRSDEPMVLIGSSLGGLAALGAANQCPEQIAHLVLLAPAVGTGRNKEAFREAEQKRTGLRSEVLRFSSLAIPGSLPATIIHGLRDDVVRAIDVLELGRRSPSARLIMIPDDHPLRESKELIIKVVERVANDQDALGL